MKAKVFSYFSFVFVFFVLGIFSCSDSDFEELPSGVMYRYIECYPDSPLAQKGDLWVMDIKYYTQKDSLLYDSRKISDNFRMQNNNDNVEGLIEEGLQLMHKGDSMIFWVDATNFFNYSCSIARPDFISDGEKLRFEVRCLSIITKQEFQKQIIENNRKQLAMENMLIHQYIESEGWNVSPSSSGIYKLVLKEGTGISAQNRTVKVHYIGSFIDGREFDNSYNTNQPLEFELGKNYVIQGWEEAIATMKKGEKSKFLIPSSLAYGVEGAQGLIPPFTSLIFEIELIDVK